MLFYYGLLAERVSSYADCNSNDFERTKRLLYRLLFFFDRYFRNHVAFDTYSRVSKSSISNQACVPYSSELSVPKLPETWSLDDNHDIVPDSVVVKEAEDDQDQMYADVQTSTMPHLISQSDLNDLVHDLNLSKHQLELLALRLKEWNLLEKETNVCSFRKRQKGFQDLFSQDGDVIFCKDDDWLFKALGLQHNPKKWRLFIDSSKVRLKAVRSFTKW
ncbi:hypothetical protein AVEN_137855-1 [Araneus ventricosus]|uniref:Uncharacterized protein n=1 Tax=Araneus ventricosus TaxID=182803 RepID=A0A4Y2NHC3_ARAVE|nr:hypothetical protein AVEN_137855-1 [Araneus ventricosus]